MTALLAILAIIGIGLLIGRISFFGITFGTSAILFVGLLAGHFGYDMPVEIGRLGLALFVFCVGIAAGPTFFRGLASHGRTMAALGGLIVLAGVLVTWLCAWWFDLPAELAGGLMAGALTSTPALGAVTDTATDPTVVAVGFGVAYPIGIITVVVFVQLAFRGSDATTGDPNDATTVPNDGDTDIERRTVRIANDVIVGKRPSEVAVFSDAECQISRVRIEDRWRPLPPDYRFKKGDHVMLIGRVDGLNKVMQSLGELSDQPADLLDADHERRNLVVTSPNFYGQSLAELSLRSRCGVTVARIRRHDMEFVPSGRTRIEFGDTITVVGEPEALSSMAKNVGHRPRALNETDLLSLILGIGLGVLVGTASLQFAGMSISLGIAGGPLMVGLILGHFRRIGPIRGSYPPAAQLLMTEGGLALFLADAGTRAGANVVDVLMTHGITLCIVASAIVAIPLAIGFVTARLVFKLPFLKSLGGTCGGLTSTPGLAALTSSTDSSQPVTSYVAAYPVALVFITIVAPMLVELIDT